MITRKYEEYENIKVFDSIEEDCGDNNVKCLDNLYSQEEKHFWFIARKEFILQNIKKLVCKKDKIIEIGAGTGNVTRYLQKHGYENMSVGEIHLKGLQYATKYGIKNRYQFDLLNSPFSSEFDAICIFDVLEHIQDDDLALKNIHKSLNKDGKVVITVPAHMWLWNRDDAIVGHKRRYIKKQLIEKLESNGFEVLSVRYFFMSIVPLLFIRTILKKDNKSKVLESEYDNDRSMNFILSNILLLVSKIENIFNAFLPNLFGGSLFVIAKRLDNDRDNHGK